MRPNKTIACTLAMLAALFFLCSCTTAPIRLTSPADGAVVSHMRPGWQELFNVRRNTPNPSSEDGLDYKDPTGFPVPISFAWSTDAPPPYVLEIDDAADFSAVDRRLTTDRPGAELYNLETGREYHWRVLLADGRCSAAGVFRTAEDPVRQIMAAPTGPVNLRDWGGKRLPGGGRTRQGMIYRGTQMEAPFEVTAEARRVMLEELRIRTDLDFRYEHQLKGRTESILGPQVQWLHYAINAYNSFEPANRATQFPLWRDVLRVFANPENYPVYMHCYGGVDRTGEVALLLDFLLGVDEEQAFFDYEFSSMAHFYRRRDIDYLQQWLKELGAFKRTPDDSTQQMVENYMLAIGVTPEEIAAIRKNLTE